LAILGRKADERKLFKRTWTKAFFGGIDFSFSFPFFFGRGWYKIREVMKAVILYA